MSAFNRSPQRSSTRGGALAFLREHKLWWLLPLVVLAALVALLIFLGRMSSVAPFMYS